MVAILCVLSGILYLMPCDDILLPMICTDDPETRDMWWKEVRIEVRSHAKALGCDTVLGYQESTSIWYVIVINSSS